MRISDWSSDVCSSDLMMDRLLGWFVAHRIAAPEEEALTALITTARRAFEDQVLEKIASFVSSEHGERLDASLADEDGVTGFSGLKADPGQPNIDNILIAARRLAVVKQHVFPLEALDRKSVCLGKGGYGRVDTGGGRSN